MPIELSPESLRHYLIEQFLPFWLRHGQDADGGWHLFLEEDHSPSPDSDFRRCVVQARQLYSFSIGFQIQQTQTLLDAAEGSLAHLVERFWDPDPAYGGWFYTTFPDGTVREDHKDTYTHAFVLLGLATYYSATGNTEALHLAKQTREKIQTHLRHSESGFVEGRKRDWGPLSPTPPRRQNPHMHLLEASCAYYEATEDKDVLVDCEEIVELLSRHFYEPETATLGEYFNEDWSPVPGERGERVEPGHHFEWAWLLYRHARLSGNPKARSLADKLHQQALANGLTESGCSVVDRIDRRGIATDPRQRVWPQTELLKSLAVRWEVLDDQDAKQHLEAAFQYCIDKRVDPSSGAWREQLAADGSVADARTYSSTVYHIVTALAELIRILEVKATGSN